MMSAEVRKGGSAHGRRRAARRLWRAAPLALLLLAGCARAPARAVLGEWETSGERMEFLDGGRLLLKHADGTVALANYGFPEKRILRVRALAATPADYRVRVTRDSLVMCGAAAGVQCLRYGRVGR